MKVEDYKEKKGQIKIKVYSLIDSLDLILKAKNYGKIYWSQHQDCT